MSKSAVVQKTIKDNDVIHMFNQMVGAEAPPLDIIIPKYESIMASVRKLYGILNSFSSTDMAKALPGTDDVANFVVQLKTMIDSYTLTPIRPTATAAMHAAATSNFDVFNALSIASQYESPLDIPEKYKNIKISPEIQAIIVTFKNIKSALAVERGRSANDCLANKDKLSDDFITHAVGDLGLQMFDFAPHFDFKLTMYRADMGAEQKHYILFLLHLFVRHAENIHKNITSPDIDVEKFTVMMTDNIVSLKSQIPRCDDAFREIEKSIGLFQSNFNGYFSDFVSSGAPSIIIENFVGDVAKRAGDKNKKLKYQFANIIKFYTARMQQSKGTVDPKIAKIIQLANENIGESKE